MQIPRLVVRKHTSFVHFSSLGDARDSRQDSRHLFSDPTPFRRGADVCSGDLNNAID